MAKWQPTLVVEASPDPLRVKLSMPFNRDIQEMLKIFGGRWAPDSKCWTFPTSVLSELPKIAAIYGLSYKQLYTPTEPAKDTQPEVGDHLYPYQKDAVVRALTTNSLILNFEMGLGKTATAIEILKQRKVLKALIVCPGIARYTWLEEFEKWWVGHPPICCVDPKLLQKVKKGKSELTNDGIIVTSYNLLHMFTEYDFDALVFDELHMLSNAKTKWGKAAQGISTYNNNTNALRLGLTGTLVPNKPANLWHPLDIIQPQAWGSWHGFVKRYCEVTSNAYTDWVVGGLRDDKAAELHERLNRVSVRKTKKEVAHMLPPITISSVIVEAEGVSSDVMDFGQGDMDSILAFMGATADTRAIEAMNLIQESVDEGVGRVCVVVYHKDVGAKILAALETVGVPSFYVDGEMDARARKDVIKQAADLDRSILVCTMSSIGTGINDLVKFPNVILAELYWQPALMAQLLARFHRLSSKEPVFVRALVLRGTVDERIADSLRTKTQDINKIIVTGMTEEHMEKIVDVQLSDEELLAQLQNVTEGVSFGVY